MIGLGNQAQPFSDDKNYTTKGNFQQGLLFAKAG